MLPDPIEDPREAELTPIHRAVDECVALRPRYLDVKSISPQEDVGCSESDTLVAIEEAMVISQRLHQGGGFFFDGIVVSGLRAENCGLNRALITDAMHATEHLNETVLHRVDFCHRQEVRHLLRKTL